MAAMEVVAVDKAVSTEDLGVVTRDIHLEVARLEAMLNTLVENKVESMKADKEKDKTKQRITSTSTASSSQYAPGRRHRHHHHSKHHSSHRHESSPGRSHRRGRTRTMVQCCEHGEGIMTSPAVAVVPAGLSDEEDDELMDEAFDFLTYQEHRELHTTVCVCSCPCACPTPCQDNHHGQLMNLPYDDDFVSITMDADGLEVMVDEAVMLEEDAEEMLRHARRKRRRKRRKRRRRQRLAAAAAVTAAAAARRETRKQFDADDLPQRARWTIVATACLLLLMCLLLVGVTLRMAPIIDDMVRKENEELLNSLSRESNWNTTPSTTAPTPAVAAIGAGP